MNLCDKTPVIDSQITMTPLRTSDYDAVAPGFKILQSMNGFVISDFAKCSDTFNMSFWVLTNYVYSSTKMFVYDIWNATIILFSFFLSP